MAEDKRKRYQIICPYCGKVQYACKSMLHEMGYNEAGHGTCIECKGFMKLIYNPMCAKSDRDITGFRKGQLWQRRKAK